MKLLILADKTINKTDLGQITREVGELYTNNVGVTPEFIVEDFTYTSYPIEPYWGGYYGIQHNWIKDRCAEVYKRYGEEIMNVIFAISSDNWTLDRADIVGDKAVWGWNHSAQFSGYGVQQVRIAQVKNHTTQRNINNSIGVIYHETMHDHDTFVFVNTGEIVEHAVNVQSWDNACVHGEHPNYEYIRYKENQHALHAIAPMLVRALEKRTEMFEKKVGLMQEIIRLAEIYLSLLRAKMAEARGDIAILPNNKCDHVV